MYKRQGDSVQEKLSLATRFGESIYYGAPSQKEYINIAKALAARAHISMDEKTIETEAVRWETVSYTHLHCQGR